ncbi:MAG: hypothetical protein M3R15_00305 [Acidobacteriota bacterium]|jgi:hypothetical protein|nr:hypothetical protein [Acidobacteriota bacterium]
MKRNYGWLLIFSLTFVVGCSTNISRSENGGNANERERTMTQNTPAARSYSDDLAELRARFNADKGKVRMLMLLSPT